MLTGLSRQRTFRRLLVAPHSLRSGFLDLVEREIAHAQAGRHGADRPQAQRDRRRRRSSRRCTGAAQAGVDIDCIIRGACSIQPGVPGVSERIRVRSIIGEFLEHSRIWGFENGGDAEWYIGSADLMDRNLDRRVEAVVPVEDSEAKARIAEIIDLMLADDRRSWQLQPDATWVRTEVLQGREGTIDTFEVLKERARRSARWPSAPRRPGAGLGLARPARVTADGGHPVEVELKYRVGDLAAAERLLTADRLGPFAATGSGPRSHADGGPLRRHRRRRAGSGRVSRSASGCPAARRSSRSSRSHAPMGRAARSAARSWKARPTGSRPRSSGRTPTLGRSSSSTRATPRWSSGSRSASSAASASSSRRPRASS